MLEIDLPLLSPSARAALDALSTAAVVIRDGAVQWANLAAANAGVTEDLGTSRLARALVDSGIAEEAVTAGGRRRRRIGLPTDAAFLDVDVTAAVILDRPDSVLVSFVPPTTGEDTTDEVRSRLEAMLEHTTGIITVLDHEGRIKFSNGNGGLLTGMRGTDANGALAVDFIHPDDIDTAANALAAAMSDSGPQPPVEIRIRFADGQWHDMSASTNNLLDTPGIEGIVVSLHDITERKIAERRLSSLIANLSDVIVVLDREYQVTFASESISSIIDAPADTNLGMNAFNDIHPEDLESAAAALDAAVSAGMGATERIELRLEQRPGSDRWRWVEATIVNLLDDPAVEGLVVTLRDITDARHAGDRLRVAYERERANAERLAELDRLKDDFLATVSHELRTPLAAIIGFVELLRTGGLPPDVASDLLDRVAKSGSEMRTMIENVLDFSAIEAHRVAVRLIPISVAESVAGAISSTGAQLDRHVVVTECDDDVVIADRHGLGHVIRNLLTNAAKYSEAGTTITIRSRRHGPAVSIEVVDEGIGIDPSDQPLVFERFFRAQPATFTARGTGVGLSIASRYVDLMGGTIDVRSVPGRGSVFTVTLPAGG